MALCITSFLLSMVILRFALRFLAGASFVILVPVRVGENVIDVGRIGARFSDFGHLSPKVAASFSPSELPFFAN